MTIHEHIDAIPTEFDGVRYKSRLEARWAVFMTKMGMRFEYEPKTFRIPIGTLTDTRFVKYTPDFYLLDFDWWVEVKPTEVTSEFIERLYGFVYGRILSEDEYANWNDESKVIALLTGPPTLRYYDLFHKLCDPNLENSMYYTQCLLLFDNRSDYMKTSNGRKQYLMYPDCWTLDSNKYPTSFSPEYHKAVRLANAYRFDLR